MSGTVTRISRASAGSAAVAMPGTGVPATGGGLHGGVTAPGSTESPHVVRPVPESC